MDFFDTAYQGTPPWDIGRPQKEFVALARQGEIAGPVLDVGCGTGEHALFFAAEGYEVWAVDSSPPAIRKAEEKAKERGIAVRFQVLDALELRKLGRTFLTVTDSGLFHTLSDHDRPVFAENLAAVLPSGGRYFMLCFSDREPPGYGPRRISQEEIRATFSGGWSVGFIRPAVFESRTRGDAVRAWLTKLVRTG